MDRPWFDTTTGLLKIDEYVSSMPSYTQIIADGMVTDEEFAEQSQRVTKLLHDLEARLSPEAKALATDALCEMSVLHTLHLQRLQMHP